MSAVIKTILNRPVAVFVCVLALILFGITSVSGMKLELYPETSYPTLVVTTNYPESSSDEVEKYVTEKIESNVGSVSGLKKMTSTTRDGRSEITLEFDYGTDLVVARNSVQEAVENSKEDFPDGVKSPTIVSMNGTNTPCLVISLNSDDNASLLTTVKQTIAPRIKKLDDVASVSYWGGEEEYISIETYPEKLIQYGLTVSDVAGQIAASNFIDSAGKVSFGSQSVSVEIKMESNTIDSINNIALPIGENGVIHISDIAYVHYTNADTTSISRFNGEDSITIEIAKKQKANVISLSNDVKSLVEEFRATYPDASIDIVYDSSDSIVSSIKSVAETLILGIILSMLVLFIFFGDFKASLIVGSSMPVSLLVTFICISKMGYTLNMITMSALVIGIGMMVDNSIVVIEMCFRKSEDGFSFYEAAYEGARLVFSSILASTLTTVVVYWPLTELTGMSGQLYSPLGYTIVFSLFASLISALSLVPLCFSKYKPKEKEGLLVNKILDKFAGTYEKLIVKVMEKKKEVAFITLIILAVSLFSLTFLKTELMTTEDEKHVLLEITFKPGTGIDKMDEITKHVEEFVANKSEVTQYGTVVSTDVGTASIDAYLSKKVRKSSEEVAEDWNAELTGYDANCNIKARKSDSDGIADTGVITFREVILRSNNMTDLKEGLATVEEAMAAIPGVLFVTNSYAQGGIQAEIEIDQDYAQAYGFDVSKLADTISDSIAGKKAMDVKLGEKKYVARVEYPKELRNSLDAVNKLIVTNENNESVSLSQVANITLKDKPLAITRTNGQFEGSISVTMSPDMIQTAVFETDRVLEEIILPSGVSICETSIEESMDEEFSGLGVAIASAVFLVFMVMAIQFESIRNSLLVMFCIPFSLIGAIVLLLITNATISMTTLMGFLMLAGIVVNDGILFVDTANRYRESMDTQSALIKAGISRARPIFMTTLTTILSMVPMCIPRSGGGDSMKGMAFVIIGGLITSTLLTLILLPAFYLIFNPEKQEEKKEEK